MLLQKQNMDMLVAHKVYTESELRSRYEIQLENYCKTVRIEALTMVDMARRQILPAVSAYVRELSEAAAAKKAAPQRVCFCFSFSGSIPTVSWTAAAVSIRGTSTRSRRPRP